MRRVPFVFVITLITLITLAAQFVLSGPAASPAVAAARAQAAVKLIPYTDATFGIQGVVPEGWFDAGRNVRLRKETAKDPTLIAQQAAPAKLDQLLTAILPQFGLKEAPKSTGTRKTATFEWTIYQFNNTIQEIKIGFALALAEKGGTTYLVLLETTQDEVSALTDSVFFPVVDALAPIVATREAVAYREEDVTFANGAVTLAGTLTLPNSAAPAPAVILVTGSGPQDRDENLGLGIKPFRLIADYLTRRGVAVLRYDDRGVAKSTGDFAAATSWDFASDAAAAFTYLQGRKDINPKQVGILGHSEGGMVTSILIGQGVPFAFAVSMAGPGAPIQDLMVTQNEKVLRGQGFSDAFIESQLAFLRQAYPLIVAKDFKAFEALAADRARAQYTQLTAEQKKAFKSEDDFIKQAVDGLKTIETDWWVGFLSYDPRPDWQKARMPVLGVYGSLDVQVDAEQNGGALEAALKAGGNKDYKVVTLKGANHLMQAATTGNVDEYAQLKQEFMPEFLPTVGDWIIAHVTPAQ